MSECSNCKQLKEEIRLMVTGKYTDRDRTIEKWQMIFEQEDETFNATDITLESIINKVSSRTHIPIEQMKSTSRLREIVEARMFYSLLAKRLTTNSLSKIGKLINRDHATILHGIKQVQEVKELKDKFSELFEGKLKTSVENKAILIGQHPVKTEVKIDKEAIKINSKASIIETRYKNSVQANNLPYHGYRVHSL